MSFKDWFNYMLKRWVEHVEKPDIEQKSLKKNKRQRNWAYQLFGIMPSSIKFSVDKMRKRFQ